jgi:hypothetical protein
MQQAHDQRTDPTEAAARDSVQHMVLRFWCRWKGHIWHVGGELKNVRWCMRCGCRQVRMMTWIWS